MNEKKLVSVIIPTYNRAKYVTRAIESCLCQTYHEIEILVVDDGSLDDTAQVVKNYKDLRIKYLLHKDNMGVSAARNTGLRNATGEFIAFLDSDDEWKPEKIHNQLKVFENTNLKIGLVFTNSHGESANQKTASGIIYPAKDKKIFPLRMAIAPPSSWMLPRDVVNKVGYFDDTMQGWEDCDYCVRLSLRYPVYFLNEKLVTWHALPEHLSKVSRALIKSKQYFLEKHYELMKQDREYLFKFLRTLGKDAILIDKNLARKYILKALQMKPFDFSTISKLIKCL